MERIVAVVGDNSVVGNAFGKQGTKSDMTLYNSESFTAIVPHTYPERIVPMLQAVELADFVVVAQEKLDWTFGEILLALDAKRKPGVFLHAGPDSGRIKALSKGTFCEGYKVVPGMDEAKKIIEGSQPEERGLTVIDHFFQIKGVGLVALGCLKGGDVKAYDKLMIYPQEKEIMIKSIQVHDVTVSEVSGFSRVGYSLKGIELDELERGSVISANKIPVSKSIGKMEYNKFSQPLKAGESAMACIGCQVRTVDVKEKIELSRPAAMYTDAVVFRNDLRDRLRIIGKITV